ncbi:TRAP transporter substrate-binding protein [Salipaludibacillus aurantiacus]|uniref:Tripartite ATP-independent transporter solute receptor, DctP family n=1 Tax=Salipaludibacillus aurantiacus TaxID=1601833 RepID=A0A1H9UCX5_9BACI|nr:TRAP transporter substrate-binding protein [Salipaludibacillus aurantiacus]SES07296.1 tripartite ATP-independent transporter solute receptor, DctP family [Salipaludibacillus aurantiacus]
MLKKSLVVLMLMAAMLVAVACGNNNNGNTDAEGNNQNQDDVNAAAGEGEDSIKIVAAHNQTDPENPYQDGLLEFKEVAESESGGSIEVEVHAGTLGTSESELVESLQVGGADVVLVSPGFMSNTGIREIDLFALPYLFDSYDHWEQTVDGEVGDEIADIILEESDNKFKLVGYWSAGVRHYYGKQPLQSIDDLQGMTIRTQTSGVVADFWNQTGAVPTDVDWGELYQALQQNVVDSAENAYPYFVQQNHHETDNGRYTTETGHDYTTRFLLINNEEFESYSEEHQDIILEAAAASVEAERQALYEQEEEYRQQLLEDGGEINEIDKAPFIEIAEPLQDEVAEEIGVTHLLEQIRDMR